MPALERISIDLIGIGNALLNKRLLVPFYQRSYAWEDKHILDLFSDINAAIKDVEPEYFLGSIVTTKSHTPRPEVVDGQQRLATTTILLGAIRDYFYKTGDKDRASQITATYLQTKQLSNLELIPKLQLNDADNSFFLKRILTEPDSPDRMVIPTKESHKKIVRAAELAEQNINRIGGQPNPTQNLVKLVDFIENSLKVIWVSVADDANAFTIFETLNDRGLSLAISDLLKNYLFGTSQDRVAEVQQLWMQMIGSLEAIGNEEIIVTYIRHLWCSKYGSTREKELYSEIKKKIRNKSLAVEFAEELSNNAKHYAAILNSNHEFWQAYGQTASDYMATLNLLRMIQIRPLILAVIEKFSIPETKEALRLIVSWVARFLIVGGLGGGALENHYSQRAKEIRDGTIINAKQLSQAMKKTVPSDRQFEVSFQSASVSVAYLARYYLRVLENQKCGEKDPELVPNDNVEQVNLEHVLPQNPSTAWNYILEEDRAAYVNRIGNLALLKNKINTEAGNDSFDFKRPFYEASKYLLTKEIALETKWDTGKIISRQISMAKLAVDAWPLS